MLSPDLRDVFAARKTISGVVSRTPLVPSPYLSSIIGQQLLFKLELTQPIGAFKLRGAVNAIFNLTGDINGVTCCSTGNHGRGVAYAAKARGIRAVICMSKLVPQTKIDGIKALGAEVRIVGDSQGDALVESNRLVEEEGLTEISPFDDPYVIAGQGTIGLEMIEQNPELSMVVVPLSGGGLAGGIAVAVKRISPSIHVVGVSMDRGAAMYQSLEAGKPVEVKEYSSLADSLGGGIGMDNRFSFDLCRNYIDDVVLVSEQEIYRAMQTIYFEDRIVCEGGSAVGVAALLEGRIPAPKGPVATVLSGRNIDMEIFTKIVSGESLVLGDYLVEGRQYERSVSPD
ncbi:MAG: hydroxyectoine utilization dehydratase EutB [bacterium]